MKTQVVLRAWAERTPEREALVCGETRLTYRELEARTNQIARVLVERGVRSCDRVALLLENGIAWPEMCLAAIKLGALVVPVSTRLTAAEIAFILGDAQPYLLIFTEALRAVAERAASGLRLADAEIYAAAALASETPLPVPAESDDCMILYTSGTSGTPKGAITTHANLILIAMLNNRDYDLRQADRFLVTTAFAHRAAIARLWNAVTLGATLVVMPRFDAAETLATIVRERISVTGLVPTVARMLLDAFDGDATAYGGLRTMLTVGETFPVELKRRLFAALPGVKLFGAFALTEVFVAMLSSEDQVTHAAAAGRPIPGVEVRLLDESGAEVATGAVGEIVVRCGEPGRWLAMRGYWNRPAETAETIRDGWVHSGDLGRFDDAGYLYVVDRKKDMILSGGLNIYSKEVERAILGHPAVGDVAVVSTADAQFGEAVVAFVEVKRDAAVTAAEIIAHCRDAIASYKKPKYVFFETLPRNGQGKTLKTELRLRAAALTAAGD